MGLITTFAGKSRSEILTGYAVEFDGSATYVDCGSGATLDDIPSGAEISVGAWVRVDEDAASFVIHKGTYSTGWYLSYSANWDRFEFFVNLAATNCHATTGTNSITADGKWHFVAAHYDDATKTARASIDGVWGSASVGAGAYVSEAGSSLYAGSYSTGSANQLAGAIAWWETWDNDHYGAGTDFIPPRAPTAAGPGNLIETWWADEGSGATVAARVTSPANDGTITSGSWSTL